MQITRSKQYGARTHSKESATSPTAKPLAVMVGRQFKPLTIVLKRADKMPTLRKIKRAAMPLLVPTQITTH